MTDDVQFVQGGIFGGLTSQPLGWGSPTGPQPAQPVPWTDSLIPKSSGGLTGNSSTTNSGTAPADWTALTTLPALPNPSTFAPSQTSQGNVVTSQGSAGGSAGVDPTHGTTIGMPSNAQAGAQPAPASGITSGSLADYFLRAVVIILGFIFLAIGLNMFKPGLVPVPAVRA